MATLKGYVALLREEKRKVTIYIISGTAMKEQRIKAAKFIFTQGDGAMNGNLGEIFDEGDVYVQCIDHNLKCYGGFFSPLSLRTFLWYKEKYSSCRCRSL